MVAGIWARSVSHRSPTRPRTAQFSTGLGASHGSEDTARRHGTSPAAACGNEHKAGDPTFDRADTWLRLRRSEIDQVLHRLLNSSPQ